MQSEYNQLSDKDLLILSHRYNHFVKDQIDELSKYYDTIHVLVRYNKIADISKYVPIDYLKPYNSDTRINKEQIPNNVKVYDVSLLYLPLDIHKSFLGDQHLRKVRKIISKYNISFDIIHSHFTWTAGYVGSKLSTEYGVPNALTVHENRQWFLEHYESDDVKIENTWEKTDVLIRVNKKDISKLKEYNSNTVYIPNGYDSDVLEPVPKTEARRAIGISPNTKLLFSLGELNHRKGFQNVISVLPELLNKHENLQYAIGGHGSMKDELITQASELDVRDSVNFTGYIENDDLKYWMSASDVFILPSYSESFGVVQIEAMACGTPVIATKNGGSEEVITDSSHGYLVTHPENHSQLSQIITKSLGKNWDRNAILTYAEQYDIKNVMKEVATLHKNII